MAQRASLMNVNISKTVLHSNSMFQLEAEGSGQQKEDPVRTENGCRYSGKQKPPFTYTELIEYALSEKGQLTVSGIYQWIS